MFTKSPYFNLEREIKVCRPDLAHLKTDPELTEEAAALTTKHELEAFKRLWKVEEAERTEAGRPRHIPVIPSHKLPPFFQLNARRLRTLPLNWCMVKQKTICGSCIGVNLGDCGPLNTAGF